MSVCKVLQSVLQMPRSLPLAQTESIASRSTETVCAHRKGMIVLSADNNNNNTVNCLKSASLGSTNASPFPYLDAGRTGRESFYWNSLLRELYKRLLFFERRTLLEETIPGSPRCRFTCPCLSVSLFIIFPFSARPGYTFILNLVCTFATCSGRYINLSSLARNIRD